MGSVEDFSEFPANPETNINGIFKFDYRIDSDIEAKVQYTNDEGVEYDSIIHLRANYYVNTADNSMFFPKGFFKSNFGRDSTRQGSMHGAIWMPNGQMVSYVYDSRNDQKRAMLVETNQTADDVALGGYFFLTRFLSNLDDLTLTPPSLPLPDIHWPGPTEMLQGTFMDRSGAEVKATVHLAGNPAMIPIKTSMPTIGFFVGVIKEIKFKKCNRLGVFTKMEMAGGKSYIQANLRSINPAALTFDAAEYKRMVLGGMAGTTIRTETVRLKAQLVALYNEVRELEKDKRMKCKLDPEPARCRDNIEGKIQDVKKEITERECEMYTLMGVEDTMEECK